MRPVTTKPIRQDRTDKKHAPASTCKVPFFARKLDGKLVVKSGIQAGKEQNQKEQQVK